MTNATPKNLNSSSPRPTMSQNVPKCPVPSAAHKLECPNSGLTDCQTAAIELLIMGSTMTTVAEVLGIDRRTIYRWRTGNPKFRRALDRRREEVIGQATDRMRSMLNLALDALGKQVTDTYVPTSHRAARTLLSLARVGSFIAAQTSSPLLREKAR